MTQDQEAWKRAAGEYAVRFVKSGMVVGLGHGTTAIHALRKLAELIHQGELEDVMGVPTSLEVEQDARSLGIPMTTLDACATLDVTIDGADEVDPAGNAIKGGGGALLREKIVAQATRREMIVVDQTKLSPRLGTVWPVPVEVALFGWQRQKDFLAGLGAEVTLRRNEDGSRFTTDQGNLILDCDFGPIDDLDALAQALNARAGIVEHGLFLGLVSDVIIGTESGIEHRESGGG